MERSALTTLGEAVGILPKYLDQTGTEWRETTRDAYTSLLGAMGFDATSDAAAERALRSLRGEAQRELIKPVRVVERTDQTASRHIAVRLASPPRGKAGARWRIELETEAGERRVEEGTWPGGTRGDLVLPWPDMPLLGYHRVRVSITGTGRERQSEQSLIVVPSRCVTPRDLLGERRVFGFVTNLYTLRGANNWGVGDFTDLSALMEWGAQTGAAFVGLNPLHALLNRGQDISPYSPLSRLFRNPLYLDVTAIPELRVAPHLVERLDRPELQAELNVLREAPHVHYEQVMALKSPVLEELHRLFGAQRGGERRRAYETFIRAEDPELTQFATWMAIYELRVAHGSWGLDWRSWPEEFRRPESDAVRQFQNEHAQRVDYHKWVQFELDRQLGAAAEGARTRSMPIGLYQDLAIGTSPTGADAWAQPDLFVQRASVGAPPDPYSATGQNWGLPPIDPRALQRDGYRYFVRLVRSGFRHSGALRIDHVMGLFRLFWIPEGKTGKEGAFVRYPANDLLGILALESVRHNALIVGEDLGTVPEEVPAALEKWGILSSKVLYFEREEHGGFKPAARYPSLALATANTHDMATLAGFWKARDIELRAELGLIDGAAAATAAREERERDKHALLARLAEEGIIDSARVPGTGSELRGAIHGFLAATPAALVGVALDDLTGEEEAVNLPGVGPDRHPVWTRKMSMTIEEMRESEDVRTAMKLATELRTASSDLRPASSDLRPASYVLRPNDPKTLLPPGTQDAGRRTQG